MKPKSEQLVLVELKPISKLKSVLLEITARVIDFLPKGLGIRLTVALIPLMMSGCFGGISIDKISIDNLKAIWSTSPITDTVPSVLNTPTGIPPLEITLTAYATTLTGTMEPTATWTPIATGVIGNTPTVTFTPIPVLPTSTIGANNGAILTLTAMDTGKGGLPADTPTPNATSTPTVGSTFTATSDATYTLAPVPTIKPTETQIPTNVASATSTLPAATASLTIVPTAKGTNTLIPTAPTNTPIAATVIPTGTTTPGEGYSLKVFDKNNGNAMTEYHIKLRNVLCGEGSIGGNGIFFVNDQDAFYVAQKAFELMTAYGGTEAVDFANKLKVSNPNAKINGYLAAGGERVFLVNAGPDLKLHVLIEEGVATIPNLEGIVLGNNLELICVGQEPNDGGAMLFVAALIRDSFTTVLDITQ